MRVGTVKSGGYLDNLIIRNLHNNGIKGDLIEKVSVATIHKYDAIIFSYQNKIPNIAKVMEQIILHSKTTIVYVNNTMSIGHLYNLIDDLSFHIIEEMKIDSLLSYILRTTSKFNKEIENLKTELNHANEELKILKLTNKAKRLLMTKGLNEDEAHTFIIKKAMELRISKKKLVNLIIENRIDI